MDWLDQLVEARFKDWERRVREDTAPPPPEVSPTEAEGLEIQLYREIVALRQIADERPAGGEREVALARARDLELQLRVLLERSGRPLAAARIAEALRASRRRGG
jgi:hypothetical protein